MGVGVSGFLFFGDSHEKITQSRLAKLPPKVALPLTQLVKIGQMREQDLQTVLDAGDLTGNHQTLVGFAAGAMGMMAQGVPIADTVSMAKKHGGRIRLDWSPRRWREEHDRLAKVVTLRQFSEKNVEYDVEYYETALPDFPGYLIRNSRRLAIIGWHQRHCVASYHSQVMRGLCAFVCVFVNHVRWTVEIHRTEDPFNRIRINQIRTTDNGSPNDETEQKIYEYLGVPSGVREPNSYLQRNHEAYILRHVTAANLSKVHQALEEAGIEFVHMNFDPDPVPLLTLPEFALTPASMGNIMEKPLDLYTPAEDRDESGQLVIEMQTDTLGNALRQMQQKLMTERRENEYRWRRPPAREHYVLRLNVAGRRLEITQSSSNGYTLNAQVQKTTRNVDIQECPDMEEVLQAA